MYSKQQAYLIHGCRFCTQWDIRKEKCTWKYYHLEEDEVKGCPVPEWQHDQWAESTEKSEKKSQKSRKQGKSNE